MLTVFADLFIERDGNVATYRFDYNTGTLQLRSASDGRQYQPLTSEFWNWWAETVNFIPEEHKVDFAIISDQSPSLLVIPAEYTFVDATQWSLSVIQLACTKRIFSNESAEFFENGIKRFAVQNGTSKATKIFHINRFFIPDALNNKDKGKRDINGEDSFVDYLKSNELTDIIIKDITR